MADKEIAEKPRLTNAQRAKIWRLKNLERFKATQKACYLRRREYYCEKERRRFRFKLYGVTEEQFQTLLKKQNGVCAICGRKQRNGYSLCIDHNHKTGAVRGLLCLSCNTMLGWLQMNRSNIEKYLSGCE
jgi:hypothetical protein